MYRRLIVTIPFLLCACEFLEGRELFPQPTEIGSDSGLDFLRRRANVPPGADLWIGVRKIVTRSRDYSGCADSPLSPGCGSGGSTIVPLIITDTNSTFPEVADVVEIKNDIGGDDRNNLVLVRTYDIGGTNIAVDATRDDGSDDYMYGSHNVIVRDYHDVFVSAHCGQRSMRMVMPGSETGIDIPMTTFDEMVVLEDMAPGLVGSVVGVEADGSFMAGELPLDLSSPSLLSGEPVAPGEYEMSFSGTNAKIPVSVVKADEVDGFKFVAFGVVKLSGGADDFGFVPAITVPLKVDEMFWPNAAREKTPIMPVPTAGSRVVCANEYVLPEGTPAPTMTSKTPTVCEVSNVTDLGQGSVEHLSAGTCQVDVELDGTVDTLTWLIE